MAAKKSVRQKKYFNVAQANAALPLVRAIVTDITALYRDLQEREERLMRVLPRDRRFGMSEAHMEELKQVRDEVERERQRMKDYQQELENLGIQLKDLATGLVDFPCMMENREVYLCWRLGEPEVAYWHEIEAGFAGRKPLTVDAESR